MKKPIRQFLSILLAAFMIVSVCNLGTQNVNAASKKKKWSPGKIYFATEGYRDYNSNWTSSSKTRATTGELSYVYVYLPGYDDKIADLKFGKKGGVAKVDYYNSIKVKNVDSSKYKKTVTETYTTYEYEEYEEGGEIKWRNVPKQHSYSYQTTDYDKYYKENYVSCARIAYCPQKMGKLTISFKVKKADGKYRSKKAYKYNVLSSLNGDVYSKVTFGGNVIYNQKATYSKKKVATIKTNSSYKINGTGGKLKVTASPGYKITGLVVVTTGPNGVYKAKNVKNGGYASPSTCVSSSSYYDSGNIHYAPNKKYTRILISYKDTKTGTYRKYKVIKKNGVYMVKTEYRYSDGDKGSYTSLASEVGGAFSLWSY